MRSAVPGTPGFELRDFQVQLTPPLLDLFGAGWGRPVHPTCRQFSVNLHSFAILIFGRLLELADAERSRAARDEAIEILHSLTVRQKPH
jgi:hypothetical protein